MLEVKIQMDGECSNRGILAIVFAITTVLVGRAGAYTYVQVGVASNFLVENARDQIGKMTEVKGIDVIVSNEEED